MILAGEPGLWVTSDGYIDTDGTDLVYGLTDHSHIPMVDCYAISHLCVYVITCKNTYRSLTKNMNGVFCVSWKEILKLLCVTIAQFCRNMVFSRLYISR